jgi:hypothetical protein
MTRQSKFPAQVAIVAAALTAAWTVLSLMLVTSVFESPVPSLDAARTALYFPGLFVARTIETLSPTLGPTFAFYAANLVVLLTAASVGAVAGVAIRRRA